MRQVLFSILAGESISVKVGFWAGWTAKINPISLINENHNVLFWAFPSNRVEILTGLSPKTFYYWAKGDPNALAGKIILLEENDDLESKDLQKTIRSLLSVVIPEDILSSFSVSDTRHEVRRAFELFLSLLSTVTLLEHEDREKDKNNPLVLYSCLNDLLYLVHLLANQDVFRRESSLRRGPRDVLKFIQNNDKIKSKQFTSKEVIKASGFSDGKVRGAMKILSNYGNVAVVGKELDGSFLYDFKKGCSQNLLGIGKVKEIESKWLSAKSIEVAEWEG